MKPVAIAFTLIPRGPYTAAKVRVSDSTPALLYQLSSIEDCGIGSLPNSEKGFCPDCRP